MPSVTSVLSAAHARRAAPAPGTGRVDHIGSTVLVTGASSGLGAEFARRFAARGANLVLVARRRDRLDELAAELQQRHGTASHVLTADLSAPGAAADLVARLDAEHLAIDSLVNCAGFGITGDFVDQDPERIAGLVAVNITTLTELTRLLLPRLLASGRGVLVNVASTAAHQPTPGMGVYGASKAYVLSLTEAIAEEVRGSSLRVLAICPGPTRTEFFDVAGENNLARARLQTPGQVVDLALQTLDRAHRPASVVSGALNRAAARAAGVMPRGLVLRVARRAIG